MPCSVRCDSCWPIWDPEPFDRHEYVAHFGFYAVRGFFVISGLMMTAALNEVYGFDGVRFWTNRALRLLPPYYLVCALTLSRSRSRRGRPPNI